MGWFSRRRDDDTPAQSGDAPDDALAPLTRADADWLRGVAAEAFAGIGVRGVVVRPDHLVDAYGIARRNYYYRIGDQRPASRKYARARDGSKGGWITRAEEFISRRFHLPPPDWTVGEDRLLHRPWFATSLAALRAVLLLESPPAFRSRNLFVSENALSRA